jgi:hypothetical protein
MGSTTISVRPRRRSRGAGLVVGAVALRLVLPLLRGDGVALGIGLSLLEHRLAGEGRLAVDLHPAGAADRGAAGAAHGEGAVVAVLRLEDAVEDRQRWVEVDVE